MKALFIATLVVLAFSGPAIVRDPSAPLFTQEIIDLINQSQNSWTASLEKVGSMTLDQAKALANAENRPNEFPKFKASENLQYPTSFDSRTQWPGCIHPLIDGGLCAAFSAISAADVLSDRFCIASSGSINAVLSYQYLISCDTGSYGCLGGWPASAWSYLTTYGTPTNSCVGYTSGSTNSDGSCPSTCNNGSSLQFYKAINVTSYSGANSFKAAITSGGPIEAVFEVYADLFAYYTGIYFHTYGEFVGYTAVKIIAWGVQDGTEYWICTMNAPSTWYNEGYVWIAFGEVGIESNGIAGSPLI